MASAAIPVSLDLVPFVLVSVRLSALMLLSLPWSALSVPMPVRILLVLSLSAALAMGLVLPGEATGASAPWPSLAQVSWPGLATGVAREFALGALMALGVNLGFAAFAIGARLMDVQIGFGLGQVLDPATRQRLPVLSAAMAVAAPVLLLSTEGHHVLLRAFAATLDRFPVGLPWDAQTAGRAVWPLVPAMFSLGFALVAPVVFFLLLLEGALGILSRSLPQMNLFLVALPVKVCAGLAALAAWSLAAAEPMAAVFRTVFRAWDAAFAR